MKKLLTDIRSCDTCINDLPHGTNPVLTAHPKSKIVIIGQAPGRIVHNTSIPWDDKSGDNLRDWLGVSKKTFYDAQSIALIPMGFCYPGTGKSGDLPPRKECAPLWHEQLQQHMSEVKLTLLIGQYAQAYYLKGKKKKTLTEAVNAFESFLPKYFVLPHPSPRNNIWQAKNPWFKIEVLPVLKRHVKKALSS